MIRCCRLVFLFCLITSASISQPFSCDGKLLFSFNQSSPNTQIQEVAFGPFGTLFYFPFESFQDGQFEALGFNPVDNYIYGVVINSNEIVRLKADGSFEVIGQIPFLDVLNVSAGDCSSNGQYLCIENDLDQLLICDVTNGFDVADRIDLFWNPESNFTGSFTARLGDLAIDPINPSVAYAYQGNYQTTDLLPFATRNYLHRINIDPNDPNVGMVTPIDELSTSEVRKIGSLFFTASGGLFGYGSTDPGNELKQNNLIQIDKFSGNSFVYPWPGPTVFISDGCSCPYTLTFTCAVNPLDVLCTDSELTYSLTINNRFFQDITDVTLVDTLPAGMIIQEITGNFIGDITPGTGVGTGILEIKNLQISGRGISNIELLVEINDIDIDFVDNQAFLSNLPDLYGNTLASDDPGSVGDVGDPTTVISIAQTLNDFSIDITHPTTCLDANDGIVKLSAPVLIIGEDYEVKLRDENYEVSSFLVNIDNSKSFTLENMTPGEYTFFQITPQNSNCSFEMRDTTIDVIAPNEQLSATAEINTPICENSTLFMSAEVSPLGSIQWSGPGFESNQLEATIASALPVNSGSYQMIASYGACEQIREFEVEIAPAIDATILGEKEYCEREPVRLTGDGVGELKVFNWTAPDGTASSGPELNVPSMSLKNEGEYELLIDNGICSDTGFLEITLLPSPTISMPDTILTDFCQTLSLEPFINGDNNVSYEWITDIGLTCYDCPNPELLIPFEPYHKLVVVNDYLCTDTSAVRILLDKDKLIYVPNAISPNNDGKNDYLQLFPGCAVLNINKMEIFNRWGAKVYAAENINPDFHNIFWDGNAGGIKNSTGVYLYRLELELKDGTSGVMFGDVTLMR